MKRIIRGGEGVVVIPVEGDRIVKIYKDGDYFSRAATGTRTAHAILGEAANAGQVFSAWEGIPIKKESLSPNIAKKIEGFTPHIDGSYFSSVSPKLGLSIVDIADIPSNRGVLQSILAPTLIAQMIKLLTQVERINIVGYIHGDIRPSNITVHPTGHLFLIDYGLFMSKAEFYRDYQGFGFYSNPPEYLLKGIEPSVLGRIIAGGGSLPAGDPAKPICDELNTKREKYAKDYIEDFPIKSNVRGDLLEGLAYAATNPALSDTLARLDTFDSFGLASTLLTILYWHNQPSNPLLDKLKTEILMPLASFSLARRVTLASIWPKVEELKGLLRGGRRSKTHRKRKGKGRRSTKKQ